MQKLDHPPIGISFPLAGLDPASSPLDSGREAGRRLLVIVTTPEMDIPAAARRLLEIAHAFHIPLLFLGLCADRIQEPNLHRQLVTLSAMVRDASLPFEIRVTSGRNWLGLVRAHWREGDVLVCFGGQRASLGSLLEANFPGTLYILQGESQAASSQPHLVHSALGWVGSIGIILGFFWLQVNIHNLITTWPGTFMLALSIPAETWLIWIWNGLLD